MKSVCVIGLGLIGGSIVRDIKLKKLAETVYAYDKHAKSLENAKAAGWIDFAINEFNDIKDIKPDFIIVATPIESAANILLNLAQEESLSNSNTFLFGTSFSGQNLFWKKRGEFWFTNASMDFFDFFFKYGLLGTTIFILLLTRGLMRSLYESNVRNNVAILLFFAYSFFGGHVIDSVTSGSLFYYLLATMSSK